MSIINFCQPIREIYIEVYNTYPDLRQNLIYHNIKTYERKPLRIFLIKTVELYKRTVQHVDKIFRRWGPYASVSNWYAKAYNYISRLLSTYLILTNSKTTPVEKVLDLTLEDANAVMDVMLINNPIANTIVTYVESQSLYEQFIDWKQGLWEFFHQTGIFIKAMQTMRPYYYARLINNTAIAIASENYRLEQERRDKAAWYGKIGYILKDSVTDIGTNLYDGFTMSAVDEFTIENFNYDTPAHGYFALEVDPTEAADVDNFLNQNVWLFLDRDFPALLNRKKKSNTNFLPP